jgi:hypothetical protein
MKSSDSRQSLGGCCDTFYRGSIYDLDFICFLGTCFRFCGEIGSNGFRSLSPVVGAFRHYHPLKLERNTYEEFRR